MLCLLRGLALLPPPEPQQLLLCRSSVSLWSRVIFMILTNTFICKVLYNCRCLGSCHLLSGTLCPSSSSFTSESFDCCAPPSEPNHFLCLTDDSGDVLLLRLLCSMPFSSASATKKKKKKKKKKKTQRKGSGVTPLWTVKFPPAVVSTAC